MNRKLGAPAIDTEYFKDADYLPDKSSTTQLLEGWKKGQKHLNLSWKVWREEYLLSLRENSHLLTEVQSQSTSKVGDIVLIKDNMARSSWKLGKIQHLRTGVDGEIISADILLPNHMMITRAINFLYLLELPTLQKEKQEPNIGISDVELNTTDDHSIDNDKRKAYFVA